MLLDNLTLQSVEKITEDFKILDYIQQNGNTSFVAMKKHFDPTFKGDDEDNVTISTLVF